MLFYDACGGIRFFIPPYALEAMVVTKRYGADGPPQLAGRTRPVSPRERLGWFRRTGHLVSGPEDWVRRVVCNCGREDDFRVLTTNPFAPVKSLDGTNINLGSVRLELACQACNSKFTVFDNQLNGWNAVIVGERSSLPPDYGDRVKELLRPETCGICRSTRFGCLVWYCYDADPLDYDANPDDLPPSEEGWDWDEAFGAFAAWSICSRCGRARDVGQAETA